METEDTGIKNETQDRKTDRKAERLLREAAALRANLVRRKTHGSTGDSLTSAQEKDRP